MLVLVDGLEEATVVASAGDIVVVRYTTIDGRETEATVAASRVTPRAVNPEIR